MSMVEWLESAMGMVKELMTNAEREWNRATSADERSWYSQMARRYQIELETLERVYRKAKELEDAK